uniref:Uncharacterized protein n=1 Tax=Denticeps clupeoides TaxID=299321 RepID=A0AAY4A4I5_9TELE
MAARLIFNQPKYTHVTPLLTSLHWLPAIQHTVTVVLSLCSSHNNTGIQNNVYGTVTLHFTICNLACDLFIASAPLCLMSSVLRPGLGQEREQLERGRETSQLLELSDF